MEILIYDFDYAYLINMVKKLSYFCQSCQFTVCSEEENLKNVLKNKFFDIIILATTTNFNINTLSANEHIMSIDLSANKPNIAQPIDNTESLIAEINPYYNKKLSRFSPPEKIAEYILKREANHPANIAETGKITVLLGNPLNQIEFKEIINNYAQKNFNLGFKTQIIPLCNSLLLPTEWLNEMEKKNIACKKVNLSEIFTLIDAQENDFSIIFKENFVNLSESLSFFPTFEHFDDLFAITDEALKIFCAGYKNFLRKFEPFTNSIFYINGLNLNNCIQISSIFPQTAILSPNEPIKQKIWLKDLNNFQTELIKNNKLITIEELLHG